MYVVDIFFNSVVIIFKKEYVIFGGGQVVMDVIIILVRQGKFEVCFYYKIFEEEIGCVCGYFGFFNIVVVDFMGKGYVFGGEDGYVCVYQFDKGYFDFNYEVERERLNRLVVQGGK